MFISELLKAKLAKGKKKSEVIFLHFAINRERQGRDYNPTSPCKAISPRLLESSFVHLLDWALAGSLLRSEVSPGLRRVLGPSRWDHRTALVTPLSLAQVRPLQWKTSYFQTIFSLFSYNRKKSCSEMGGRPQSHFFDGEWSWQAVPDFSCVISSAWTPKPLVAQVRPRQCNSPLCVSGLSHMTTSHLWEIMKKKGSYWGHMLYWENSLFPRPRRVRKNSSNPPLHCYTFSFTVSLQICAPWQTCSLPLFCA